MESGTDRQNHLKKYKPKYELREMQPKPPIEYASVIITKASQPREIYIQIQDRDTPRFCEMVNDLQEEFRSSTVHSSSYCHSPVVGNAYVFQSNNGQCWRVLIEMKELKTVAFFVDTGHRLDVQTGMKFHEIPDKFLEIPAQAIRCHLHSVYTRMDSFDQFIFPPAMYGFVEQYQYKQAVAFFNGWSGTDVGAAGTNSLEFSADTILYRNGDINSINVQVCRTSMAYVISPNVELPEHYYIRQRLVSAIGTAGHSIIPPTMIVAFPPSSAAIEDKKIAICWTSEEELVIPVDFLECESPESIFFRTPGLMKQFVRLHNAVNSYFETRKNSSDDPINFDVGYVCAVQSEDRWYRAVVVDVQEYPEIGVTLLDKGLCIKVDVNDIRRLPEGLKRAPRMILRCTLSDVYPLSGKEWGDQITHFISNRLQSAKDITVGWKKYPNFFSGKALPVTVYFYEEESNGAMNTGPNMVRFNLNEEVISLGLATKSHVIGTVSKTAPKLVWKSLELPKVGESFMASVIWFNEKGELFLRDSRSKVELDCIRQTLNEKYRNTLPTKADLSCSPGDLCIARYKDEWFRCTILEIRGNEVKIYFADCGIVGVVGINDIRMDIILEELPVQILRCSLWNLKPSAVANTWSSEEQKSIYNETFISAEFLVNVKDAGPPIQVELAYKSGLIFWSFNKRMVEKGLAVFVSN